MADADAAYLTVKADIFLQVFYFQGRDGYWQVTTAIDETLGVIDAVTALQMGL